MPIQDVLLVPVSARISAEGLEQVCAVVRVAQGLVKRKYGERPLKQIVKNADDLAFTCCVPVSPGNVVSVVPGTDQAQQGKVRSEAALVACQQR